MIATQIHEPVRLALEPLWWVRIAFVATAALLTSRFLEWKKQYDSAIEAREIGQGFNFERERLLRLGEMKRETIAALTDARISLHEAATRLMELDACIPIIQADVRKRYPGKTDDECEARCVIELACRMATTSEDRDQLAYRLSAEFSSLYPAVDSRLFE